MMHANQMPKQQIENAMFRKLTRKARKMAKRSTPSSKAIPSAPKLQMLKHTIPTNKSHQCSIESFSRVSAVMSTQPNTDLLQINAAGISSGLFANAADQPFPLHQSLLISWESFSPDRITSNWSAAVPDQAIRLSTTSNDVFTAFLMGAAAAQLLPSLGLPDNATLSYSGAGMRKESWSS